jgi:hypothetical protein
MSDSFPCPGCGERVYVPLDYARPKIRCTICGVISEVPAAARKSTKAKPAKPAKPAPRPPSDVLPQPVTAVSAPPTYASVYLWPNPEDEESSDPYAVADTDKPRCPECAAVLELGSVVCPRCGWDQRVRRKHVQEYEPVVRRWDSGLAPRKRYAFFLAGQLGTLAVGLTGSWLLGQTSAFLLPWLVFSALMAFLLGTYDRLDLTRDRRGRVELTKTWHICFFRRPPRRIDLRLYEGISTLKDREAGVLEWLVFFMFLPGVIPAFIWWWVAIRPETLTIALTRDSGYAEEILYRGWNEAQAVDIARTLADTCRMPCSVV